MCLRMILLVLEICEKGYDFLEEIIVIKTKDLKLETRHLRLKTEDRR